MCTTVPSTLLAKSEVKKIKTIRPLDTLARGGTQTRRRKWKEAGVCARMGFTQSAEIPGTQHDYEDSQ